MQNIREVKYTEALDNKYLDGRKRGKTPKELMDQRAGTLVADDLLKEAKQYGLVLQ